MISKRLNTINIIKFDTRRLKQIVYYQKEINRDVVVDLNQMIIRTDYYKYYILIAFPNCIIGFNYKNQSFYPDYSTDYIYGMNQELTSPKEPIQKDYHFYEINSTFKCLNPAIIFYRNINRFNESSLIHSVNPYLMVKGKFVNFKNMNFKGCPPSKPISTFMETFMKDSGIMSMKPPIKDEFNDIIDKQTRSESNQDQIINIKTSLYLQKKLKTFIVTLMPNSKLELPMKYYFPYSLASIQPIQTEGFSLEFKLNNDSKFLFPKILSNSSIYRGIINKKSSGVDVVNIILIQGGRNVLYSNLLQSSSFKADQGDSKKFSYIEPNEPVLKGNTFRYQIKSKAQFNGNAFNFKQNSTIANHYLKELGLDLGFSSNNAKEDINNYWKSQKKHQMSLEKSLKKKQVINFGASENQGDCNLFQNEFMFREKKNLMELMSFNSNSVYLSKN